MKKKDEEIIRLTPWGCLHAVLMDYGINADNVKGKVGEHIVEDFMELMVTFGHVGKAEDKS